MTTEISGDEPAVNLEKTSKENRSSNTNPSGDDAQPVNGISNGYIDKNSKKEHSSDKDKHREKDKDRHRDKPRDKDKGKEKLREKDKHASSSSSKDKEKHNSSSSSKDKDKERKHKDERKDKEREHKSSSSKDKEHKSSSSSKDKERDKHNSSSSASRDKDKDKDKHSSSSGHRDKVSGSSSSSKDKHSSSSNKDKPKHSSSEKKPSGDKEKDKHKSKDPPKDKVKSKDDERQKEKKPERVEERVNKELVKVKQEELEDREDKLMEPVQVQRQTPIKEEPTNVRVKVEPEEDSDEDMPLAQRAAAPIKRAVVEEDSEDDVPLMARKKIKKEKPSKKRKAVSDDEEEDFKPNIKKKAKKEIKKEVKKENSSQNNSPKKKKKEDEVEVWKWWEESEKKESGVKWNSLEHKGPVFAPPYEPLPSNVKFYYNGKEVRLSAPAEEVATFYARMLDHDYVTKDAFNKNFMKDWRKQMTSSEQEKIVDLTKCNFKDMHAYFVQKNEERKAMSKEEKKKLKEANEELVKDYGFCTIDGHKEKIGNFRIEPPGLFRGRGEHPKMGMLKKRVVPEDVIINCSKGSKVPPAPNGHKWKEVRHDNSVTWLASWTENVQGQVKYVMLNPSSKLKGEKDWQKYEVARKLHKCINKIRTEYRADWKSKEMRIRQRSVALYFIDKLALRAGNEKDEDQADTVGCCSLRVEHISLSEELNGKEWVVVFDFLGKDSIRYYNEVSVEKRVFKNLQLFMQNKATGDDLFDRLNTMIMNKHLGELMEGLTAKVFRTYNASITLQEQLEELTDPDMTVQEKILAYNRANRAVAILCNHQRAIPKTFGKSMDNMKAKIDAKQELIIEAEKQLKNAKRECKNDSSAKSKIELEKKKKALERLNEQMEKLNCQATDKEENKDIALGTSKLNYLDPRISVAWCKKHDVPIEKVYNKTQRSKFNWAIDMATEDYVF